MKNYRIFTFLLIALLVSCSAGENENDNTPKDKNSKSKLVAVTFHQRAAEYKALCKQSYDLASLRLIAINDTTANPDSMAIVLDLDETVLDNSPYFAWLVKSGNSFSRDTWKRWTNTKSAKLITGAKPFLELADSLGFNIYYISNRVEDELIPTMSNLKALGCPQVAVDNIMLKTATSDKEPRRLRVTNEYQIVLLIGDNMNDFNDSYENKSSESRNTLLLSQQDKVGAEYIIIPNVMYGYWLFSLFNYEFDKSAAEIDNILLDSLQSFEDGAGK